MNSFKAFTEKEIKKKKFFFLSQKKKEKNLKVGTRQDVKISTKKKFHLEFLQRSGFRETGASRRRLTAFH